METNRLVGSNPIIMLPRQTCGQRSSMTTGSKHRARACYLCIWFRYTFLLSKFRRESDLGLCTFSIWVCAFFRDMPKECCSTVATCDEFCGQTHFLIICHMLLINIMLTADDMSIWWYVTNACHVDGWWHEHVIICNMLLINIMWTADEVSIW